MKGKFLKHIKVFFASLVPTAILFVFITSFAVEKIPKDSTVAKANYSGIPYSNGQTVFFLKTTELPVNFILNLSPKTKSFFMSAIPNNSIKKSSIHLNECKSIDDFSNFFEREINYIVELKNQALKEIIDFSNGIVAKTPYGIPSPTGNLLINDDGAKTRLYSGSVLNLLSAEEKPDSERLEYCSHLMCLVVKAFLTDLDDEKYFLLKENSNIDLSYAEYYNNKQVASECANTFEFSAYVGVWINDLFYLM